MSAQDIFEEHVSDLSKFDTTLAGKLREEGLRLAELYKFRRTEIQSGSVKFTVGLALSENAQHDRKLKSDLATQDIFSGKDSIYKKWGLGNARALLNYERALIAADNLELENLSPSSTFEQEQKTGLYKTSNAVTPNVVLHHDEYPLQPQTDGFQRTHSGRLEELRYPDPQVDEIIEVSDATFDPTARLQNHFRDSRPPAEDIGYREARDGVTSTVVDINARAISAVTDFVAKIDVPEVRAPEFSASLFEPVLLPSEAIIVATRDVSKNNIETALAGKPNGAVNYIQAVRGELLSLTGDARKAYIDSTLIPDRDYVLARLEGQKDIGATLGILQGLDLFLKREVAKVYPVPNPVFETQEPEADTAPATAPAVAKTPPAYVPVTLTDVIDEGATKPLSAAIPVQPQVVRTPPAFVPTLTDVLVEPLVKPQSFKLPEYFSPARLKGATETIINSAQTNSMEELKKFHHEFLIPEHLEIHDVLKASLQSGVDASEIAHILDYNDLLRQTRKNVEARITTYEQAAESLSQTTKKEEKPGLFSRLASKVSAGISGFFKKPEPEIAQQPASIPLNTEIRADVVKPSKPSFWNRVQEKVQDLTPAFPVRRAAALVGGLAIAVGLTTAITDNNTAPEKHASASGDVVQAKVDLPPPAENVFTANVPADKAAPQATVEATSTAPEVKTPVAETPSVKTIVKTAKADFSVKATEVYKMPDALKVQFNDGSTSRFDKETWQKACDQIGKGNVICDELSLKNG